MVYTHYQSFQTSRILLKTRADFFEADIVEQTMLQIQTADSIGSFQHTGYCLAALFPDTIVGKIENF
jgi:hypothetical protein